MSIHDLPDEFEVLLNQLLNSAEGEFTPEQFERFQKFLQNDIRAMEVYFEYLDIEAGIYDGLDNRLEHLELSAAEVSVPLSSPPVQLNTPSLLPRYFLVIAISFMSFVLIERFATGKFFWQKPFSEIAGTSTPGPTYVATLTRSTDCVWGGETPPDFSGQRLMTKSLILEQGVAEFRFDTGTRLIIEGPTKIDLVTGCCAKLEYGKMVLHGYEPTPEFSLITPRLTFHDIGTEYGAHIHKDGEVDLHVFQGAVRVDANQKNKLFADSVIVNQGEARALTETSVGKIELQPELFNREVPGKAEDLQSLRSELHVYDCFHPRELSDPKQLSKWQNSGFGWNNPWRKDKNSAELAGALARPDESISRSNLTEDQRGVIELRRPNTTAWRTLQKPIRMDTNAIYYLSFYMKRISRDADDTSGQYGNLSLHPAATLEHPRKILLGMSSEGYATLQADMQIVEKAPPLETEKTYYFVAKIVAGKSTADQVFLRTYAEDEAVTDLEPPVWTCFTTPFDDSNVYDFVRLHVGRRGDYLFDELRIGTTWKSVVDPDLPRLILGDRKRAAE